MTGSEASATQPKVAVIGLGQMGGGVARNLDKAGLLTAAYDVAADAFGKQNFSAAVANASPYEIGATCDVIIFVVPASPQIEAVLSGPDGILASEKPGQILCDFTTSFPPDTLKLVEMARAAGRDYLDCGMTGGATGADTGKMSLFIGGDKAVLERARPVLEKFTVKLMHLGPSGAGHAMKLVHNMILHTGFLATVEGCRILEDAGLDLAAVVDALNSGNARSYTTEFRFPKHILSEKWDARSYVSNLAKDLGMAVKYSNARGRPAYYGTLTSTILNRAIETGHAKDDFALLYKLYDELADSFDEPIRLGQPKGGKPESGDAE